MDLVSIVITVYNCEKYIEKLLDSVINQTYKNLEIIIVNDGSKDDTLNICKKYSSRDKRIKIISQKNAGVSCARNKGIDKVTGKYIYFCDSDDYLELDTIEKMVDIYRQYDVELVVAGYFSEVETGNSLVSFDKIFNYDKCYSSRDELKKDFVLLWDKHLLYNIWNKLYLTKIIKDNKIYYPNYNWGEDIQFNRDYLLHISKLYNMSDCFYHYIRARKGSATDKYIENLFEIRKKEYYDFCDFFELYDIKQEQYLEFSARRHIERLVGCVENISRKESKLSFIKKVKRVREIICDKLTRKCLKEAKVKSLKMKILLIPFRLKLPIIELFMCYFIRFVKVRMPGLFNKLKNRR